MLKLKIVYSNCPLLLFKIITFLHFNKILISKKNYSYDFFILKYIYTFKIILISSIILQKSILVYEISFAFVLT